MTSAGQMFRNSFVELGMEGEGKREGVERDGEECDNMTFAVERECHFFFIVTVDGWAPRRVFFLNKKNYHAKFCR